MNIFDTKTMMQLNVVGEFSATNAQQNVQSKTILQKLDSFPTLLNIPWNGQDIQNSDHPENQNNEHASEEYEFGKSENAPQMLLESSVAEFFGAVQSGKELPGGELAKAIAHVLTMNSNLSISIDVENADTVKTEKERLIDRYQLASAAGTAPVFSWSSQYAPNFERLDGVNPGPLQTTYPPQEKYSVMPQRSQSIHDPDVMSKTPVQVRDNQDISVPVRENNTSNPIAKSAAAEPDQKVDLRQPVGDRTRIEALVEQRIPPEPAKKILPEPVTIERQTQISNVKKEGHIPFLQPLIPTQVPELISRVSTGLQTSGSFANPESKATGQTATKAVARIEVQLVPKNLGTVQVSIQKQDGMVSVLIRTETNEAEKILSNETNSIREALKSANLTLDEIRIQPMGPTERETEIRGGKQVSQEAEYNQQDSYGFGRSESEREEQSHRHNVFDHAGNRSDFVPESTPENLIKRPGLYL